MNSGNVFFKPEKNDDCNAYIGPTPDTVGAQTHLDLSDVPLLYPFSLTPYSSVWAYTSPDLTHGQKSPTKLLYLGSVSMRVNPSMYFNFFARENDFCFSTYSKQQVGFHFSLN